MNRVARLPAARNKPSDCGERPTVMYETDVALKSQPERCERTLNIAIQLQNRRYFERRVT
jgi:hypothetical protein